jgi:hypothetical protein
VGARAENTATGEEEPMNQEETVELEVRLEFADYLWASYWYHFRKPGMKLLALICSIYLVAIPVTLAITPGRVTLESLVMPLLLPAGLLLFVASVYFGAKRSLASNRSLQDSIRYRFSADGIDVFAESSYGHTSWDNIYAAYEIRHAFLILISHSVMYTLPKRCFKDHEQFLAFQDLLEAHLGERATLNAS